MKEHIPNEKDIAIRAIEAFLTADKIARRKDKAKQILLALEQLGWASPREVRAGKDRVRDAFRFPRL